MFLLCTGMGTFEISYDVFKFFLQHICINVWPGKTPTVAVLRGWCPHQMQDGKR